MQHSVCVKFLKTILITAILVLDYIPDSKIFGLIMYPCVCSKKLNVHFGANKLGMAGMQDRFPNMIFTTITVAFSIIDLV